MVEFVTVREGYSTERGRKNGRSDHGPVEKGSPTNIFIGRKNRAVTEASAVPRNGIENGDIPIVIRDKEDRRE